MYQNENDKRRKVPLSRRLSYGLTDGCGNLLYCIIGSYLLYFYTDVFGLSVAAAGAILLFTRLLDAVDAPVWGFIVDHTKSKYGRSRPYFLWLCVPFAVFMWLTFTTPDLSGGAKIAYAAGTYILAGIFYTGIQTAITSILPNLTNRPSERVVLNTFRMVGGNVGAFVCMTFTLPLVAFFGGGDEQKGFSYTLAFFGIIAVALFITAFKNMREVNVEKIERIPIKDSVKAIKGNWPWILVVAANLIFWIALTIRLSTVVYYCQYYLGDKDLTALMNGIMLVQVLGMISIPFLVGKLKKYGTMILGFVLVAGGHIAIFFTGSNIEATIVFWIIASLGQGIACSMPFAMLSDTVDFGEWKTGVRASGFLTAIGSAFCIKAGSGIGGFFPTVVMDMFGYVPNAVQTADAVFGIQIAFTWLPAIIFICGIVPMLLYRKYEQNEEKIIMDLIRRNSAKI